MPALLPAFLASSFVLVASEHMPQFDPGPSCRAAAEVSVTLERDTANCLRDERAAQAKLAQKWPRYTPAEQRQCSELSLAGGMPSYVELLTCLEEADEAARVPDDLPPMAGAVR